MMPIVAANLTNVYASLDKYLSDHLLFPDGSAIALRLHNQRRFIPPVDDPWAEVHFDFLGLNTSFRNRVSRTSAGVPTLATERSGYLQLNLFQRARIFATRYLLTSVRDVVAGAFAEGDLIEVLDFASINAPPTYAKEGWLVVDGTKEHQIDNAINSGVVQMVVQIQTRYLEIYTRSV
jgi:hypothetical protein